MNLATSMAKVSLRTCLRAEGEGSQAILGVSGA